MVLYKLLNDKIKEAKKIAKNGDTVCLEIFHIANRHYINNPILIQEEDGIYVTDGNGCFYNLKHFADIEIKIDTGRKLVKLQEY